MMNIRTRAVWRVAGLIAGLLLARMAIAEAHPPPGTDPDSATSLWFRSLSIPGTGMSCCSLADCRPVQFRTAGDHYEAFIDKVQFVDGPDAWVAVPNNKILRNKINPTGRAQACWTHWGGVLCFVLPSMA